jgi:aspartate aminotransferase
MSDISRRIGAIAPSATLAVSAKAKALRAEGKAVIGFGAGEPDFPTPAHIVEAAVEAARDPKNHKYSPAAGLPELRQAIADKTLRDSGVPVAPSQVLVTNGGKHAIYTALATLLNPDDEVILPAPYWVSYPEQVRLAGGVAVVVSASDASGFKVSIDQLDAALTDRTKALIFVSPSNPTGAVYSEAETKAIAEWCVRNDVWLLTDEIYEHLVYGQATFSSAPGMVPSVRDKCIILNGVAKTYAMTGWRVGWLIGPVDFIQAASGLQSHLCSNVANVTQQAATAALTGPQEVVADMHAEFDLRRRVMVDMLNAIEGVSCEEPEGAFYAFPSFEGVLGKTLGGVTVSTTQQLADIFLDEVLVAVVPGEAFHSPGHMRFSYALGMDDLIEGMDRLKAFLG